MSSIKSERKEGDGMKIRGKACESGWSTCDSIRKVPTVGHLGHASHEKEQKVQTVGHLGHASHEKESIRKFLLVTRVPEMTDGWNFPYAITCGPAAFARFPSYLHTITFLSLTFDAAHRSLSKSFSQ